MNGRRMQPTVQQEDTSHTSRETDLWKQHGYMHWLRNLGGKDLRASEGDAQLQDLLRQHPLPSISDASVLDIGCGGGKNLHYLARLLNAKRAVGTEVHDSIVARLSDAFPEYEFHCSDTKALPFDTDTFDVVIIRSVLALIDRNDVLQAAGEAIRVCKTWLIQADYTPHAPYATVNKHINQQHVFKMDYRPMIQYTGLMKLVATNVICEEDPWNRMVMSLYKKVNPFSSYPIRSLASFQGK